MKARPWSHDEESALIEMRDAGKSLLLIAKALGRTENSCAARWYLKIMKRGESAGTFTGGSSID